MNDKSRPPASGTSRVTVHDVARLAGVSIGTVSRVVHQHPAVATEARQKVLAAIALLGWRPNAVAQSMRTAATLTIGCIFSDIRNPLYAAIIKGAEEKLAASGYTLMVANSDGLSAREVALIELFKSRRADGLILSITDETSREVVDAVATADVPTVLVERDLPLPVCSVGTDHYHGMRRAADYLISLGHQRIALLTGGRQNRAGRERLRGFTEAFQHAGIPVDPGMLHLDSLSADYAFREAQALLRLAKPPTAIIAAGNQMLAGVLRATQMKGTRIPEDLSIISSGASELAELATPPVTEIRWDLAAIGREAADLLLSLLRGASVSESQRVELPIELVLRASCTPPRSFG